MGEQVIRDEEGGIRAAVPIIYPDECPPRAGFNLAVVLDTLVCLDNSERELPRGVPA